MKWCLIILICILIILFQACKSDDSAIPNPHAAKILSQLNTSDTFLVDFPPTNDYLDSIFLTYLPTNEKWLKLRSLQKGYDSIEIRVWYGCDIGCGHRLVRLFNDRKKWQAEISNLTYYGGGDDGPFKYLDSMSKEIQYKKPKSGWVSFIDSLFALDILTLPDDNRIPNFQPNEGTDGNWVQVEIATKNAYRYYTYLNPDFLPHDYWQAKNIVKTLKLISTEFNISEWPEGKLKKPKKKEVDNKKEKIQIRELNLDSIENAKKKMK